VANEQARNIYRLIWPASIRHTGQCRCKLATRPKVSLLDAASGVLSGRASFPLLSVESAKPATLSPQMRTATLSN